MVPVLPGRGVPRAGCRLLGAAVDEAAGRDRAATVCGRSSSDVGGHAAGGLSSGATSSCSTCPASTRSTCPTGPTATPAAAARCWPRSSSATAPAASWSTPAASCPTTCRWCWSTPPSPTRSTDRRCCRSTGRSLELLRFALIEAGTPYAGVLEAVCATLPGASPADRAAVHRDGRGRPAARGRSGLDAVRPAAAARCGRTRAHAMNVAAVGRAALPHARRPGRRHHLALPLRPVRLDHPLLPAV